MLGQRGVFSDSSNLHKHTSNRESESRAKLSKTYIGVEDIVIQFSFRFTKYRYDSEKQTFVPVEFNFKGIFRY